MNWALGTRSPVQTVCVCNFDLHFLLRSSRKVSKGYVQLHVKTNMCDLIFTILVWTESLLEAGLTLCMCNLFDKITFIGMSNQTCQYMILDVLRLHFVNWVMETRCQVFAFASLNVNVTYHLDKILLYVFVYLSLGLLTSARKNICTYTVFKRIKITLWE